MVLLGLTIEEQSSIISKLSRDLSEKMAVMLVKLLVVIMLCSACAQAQALSKFI